MTILYEVTKYERFDSKVEWFIVIDVEKKELEWISFPHAPDGMHERLADNYMLGGKHYHGKQSPIDFKLNPKYELNVITHRILHAIADDFDHDETNIQDLQAIIGNSTIQLIKVGGHIYPRYRCELDSQELFTIEDISELEIVRLDLLILALSKK